MAYDINQHVKDRNEGRYAFLRREPDFDKDGFDLATGQTADTKLRLEMGIWREAEGLDGDEDLNALRSLHEMAGKELFGMIDALRDVRDEDDPSLNPDGRLKMAARILEPKLERLAATAEREFARVDAEIEREEAEIARSTKVGDAADAVMHDAIRRYWSEQDVAKRVTALSEFGVGKLDTATLQALAAPGVPPYLVGLTAEQQARARAELGRRMAPDRTRRVAALRDGKAVALQALSALDRKANRLLDFNRARQLIEIEAKRAAR